MKISFPIDRTTPFHITSVFGWRTDPYFRYKVGGYRKKFHGGLDITVDGRWANKTIYAVSDGYVKKSKWMGGLGKGIVIMHSLTNDMYLTNIQVATVYGHLKKQLVYRGQYVTNGQPIGIMGSTGKSTGLHLHFEVRVKKDDQKYWGLSNPQKWF